MSAADMFTYNVGTDYKATQCAVESSGICDENFTSTLIITSQVTLADADDGEERKNGRMTDEYSEYA